MKKVYSLYKGKTIEYPDGVKGLIVGFCDNNLIGACECNPTYSFRRLDKNTFIEEEYKSNKYRYFYVLESVIEKQYLKQI